MVGMQCMRTKRGAWLGLAAALCASVAGCQGFVAALSGSPRIVAAEPSDGDTEIDLGTAVRVEFDQPMDARSLTAETFMLAASEGTIEATVAYDAATRTATLTPAAPLALGTTYSVTLSSAVRDVGGQSLGAGTVWSFTTRVGEWGAPEDLGEETAPRAIVVAGNARGDVVVAWEDTDSRGRGVWASRFDVSDGWQAAERIASVGTDVIGGKHLHVDAEGQALLLWEQSAAGDAREALLATAYVAGSGWRTPAEVSSSDDVSITNVRTGQDDDGQVTVVWREAGVASAGGPYPLWFNYYSPAAGWTDAEVLAEPGQYVDFPVLDVRGDGAILAAWVEVAADGQRVVARRGGPNGAWQAATEVARGDGADLRFLRLAQNAEGDAVLLWVRDSEVWASRSAGGGWSSAEAVDEGAVTARAAVVVIDANGNATAAWVDERATAQRVRAARQAPGAEWTASTAIDEETGGAGLGAYVDRSGRVLVTWTRPVFANYVEFFANRYVTGAGWGTPERVNDFGAVTLSGVSPSGVAQFIWAGVPFTAGGVAAPDVDFPDTPQEGIWARRFEPAAGWGGAERLDTGLAIVEPAIGQAAGVFIDEQGRVTAAWLLAEQVYGSRFE